MILSAKLYLVATAREKLEYLGIRNEGVIGRIFLADVDRAITRLSTSIGHDFILSKHIEYMPEEFKTLLARLYSYFVIHTYVPDVMLIGELRPTSKNSVSQQFVSDNYRPVLNSLILLKLFEYTLEPTLSKHVNLNNRQFGYRQGTGCMMAAAVVKETIHQYTTKNTNVHAAVLDMSKASDRINHKKLFMKLIDTSLPPRLLRLLII